MMSCSYVCEAETIPHSSLWRVDIFCSALSKLLELKALIRFPSGTVGLKDNQFQRWMNPRECQTVSP